MTLNEGTFYSVILTNKISFTGKFIGKENEGLKFETTDSNSTINPGGSLYVFVPAYFIINPLQIVMAKEIYTENCKEYWMISDNTYDFENKPTKVLLTDWQKNNIEDVELYNSFEECEEAAKAKNK